MGHDGDVLGGEDWMGLWNGDDGGVCVECGEEFSEYHCCGREDSCMERKME